MTITDSLETDSTTRVGRALDALIADRERQGGHLAASDVERTIARRSLSPIEARALRELLADQFEVVEDALASPDRDVPRPERSASTLTGIYFAQIAKYPLLDAADEVRLARAMRAGERASALTQVDRPPTSQEARAIERGHEARQRLICCNLRLVISVARWFSHQCDVPLLDLIQAGNVGLHTAAERFDPERGFKFSTYATWWIRQAVMRTLDNTSRVIRIPVHMLDNIRKTAARERRLTKKLGRKPRDVELAADIGASVADTRLWLDLRKAVLSLDSPLAPGNPAPMSEFVPAKKVRTPDEHVAHDLLKEDLERAIRRLRWRERIVLKLRYGICGWDRMTLESIGGVLKVTRERVRQIEQKAITRLQTPSLSRGLRDYVG